MAIESIEMAKIEEVHQQREDRDYVPTGEVSASEEDNGSYVSTKDMAQEGHEAMEVDENVASSIGKSDEKQGDNNDETAEENTATAEENVGDEDMVLEKDNGDDEGKQEKLVSYKDDEVVSENAAADINITDEPIDDRHKSSDFEVSLSSKKPDESDVHEFSEDDKDVDSVKNGDKNNETIELNDSEANDGDEDSDEVIIIDDGSPKKKGPIEKRRCSSELEIIDLDTTPVKKKVKKSTDEGTSSQSARNLTKGTKGYKLDEDDELARHIHKTSEKSHIGENFARDPLAFNTDELKVKKERIRKKNNKKEPNFVIIDTNSILSGQRPVPINEFPGSGPSGNSASSNNYAPIFPMAVPVQGMHLPYMRASATSTPVPMTSTPTLAKPATLSSTIASPLPSTSQGNTAVLPALTANTSIMFAVEEPSFVVPYLCVQPPVSQFKTFLEDPILEQAREQQKKGEERKKDGDDDDAMETDDVKDNDEKSNDENHDLLGDPNKPYSDFETPLGKFFMDIGLNQVQEYVQSDLLKKQKRQRDREGQNVNTIQSLMKDLEYSKEKNKHFKSPLKKCEYCNFKTESLVVMANHLEMPHIKNNMYKCNFCSYEVQVPHDILSHMGVEHAVIGRLDPAPAFHQCTICPFENNHKGNLTRHSVSCMRKYNLDKNILEPPVDWELPAKTPKVPKSEVPMRRGRGRPPINKGNTMKRKASNVIDKQAMAGCSVLVPMNDHLSKNQVPQQQSHTNKLHQQDISINPLPGPSATPSANMTSTKLGDTNQKKLSLTCEICDFHIKDLEQLRNHMGWIHQVTIHPKMIHDCKICLRRFITDQGLERHLLCSHGLVTSSMQAAVNKSKSAVKCPVCKFYHWNLFNHLTHDHGMTLKLLNLSYRCTVCTAAFGTFKQFEKHLHSAHSNVAKRAMNEKVPPAGKSAGDSLMKPIKINDQITTISPPAETSISEEDSPATPRDAAGSSRSL